MKKALLFILAIFLVCIAPLLAEAGGFDGSAPLLCAAVETFDCVENGDCQQGTPQSINFPQFLKINFKTKIISGGQVDGKERTSKIKNMEHSEGRLILQGTQNGKGWSIVITETTGNMTLSASDNKVGFVVFGGCTPQ